MRFEPKRHVEIGREFLASFKAKDEATLWQMKYLANTLNAMDRAFKDLGIEEDFLTHYTKVMETDWLTWAKTEEKEETPTPNPQKGWKEKGHRHKKDQKEARKAMQKDKRDRKRQEKRDKRTSK